MNSSFADFTEQGGISQFICEKILFLSWIKNQLLINILDMTLKVSK